MLSGDAPQLFATNLASLLTGRNPRGGSVELTLNKAAQQAAYKALQLPERHLPAGCRRRARPDDRRDPRRGVDTVLRPVRAELAQLAARSRTPGAATSSRTPRRAPGESAAAFEGPGRRPRSTRASRTATNKGCSDVPDDPTAFYAKNPTRPDR